MRRLALFTAALCLVSGTAAAQWDRRLASTHPTQCVDRYSSSRIRQEADAILEGKIDVGIFGPVDLGMDLTWREDPFSDANWRHRLHFLRWPEALREVYLQTSDPVYLDTWRSFWLDWEADNPLEDPASETAWAEHPTALRAKVLACALEEHPEEHWITPLLTLHAQVLAEEDFYVGRGNHALNQAQGLLAAGCVLRAPQWIQLALDRIGPLADESIDAAGATNEGSVSYAIYNYERYAEALRRIESCGQTAPAHLGERLPRLSRFIAHALLPDGTIPLIGDANAKHPLPSYGPEIAYALTHGREGRRPSNVSVSYERGGWGFGRSSWEPSEIPDSVVYALRTGHREALHSHDDLGHLSIYGYGKRLIEDSGLHAYDSPLNKYFYRPVAHNGVLVKNGTYRTPLGSRIVYHRLTPEYDLYELDLPVWKGVRWIRRVLYARDANWFIVDDLLRATRARKFTQQWHLAPKAYPTFDNHVMRTRNPRGNVSIAYLNKEPPELKVVAGRQDPMQGFIAIEYGDLTPVSVVQATKHGKRVRFITLLSVGAKSEFVDASGIYAQRGLVTAQIERAGRVDLLRWENRKVTLSCIEGC